MTGVNVGIGIGPLQASALGGERDTYVWWSPELVDVIVNVGCAERVERRPTNTDQQLSQYQRQHIVGLTRLTWQTLWHFPHVPTTSTREAQLSLR